VGLIPNTGQQISFGKVYSAYSNASYVTAAGTNVRLSATLGYNYGGKAVGAEIKISVTFGGQTTPYTYPS